jgi:3-(3-hydroxy-phenyl)propionate hydroxylase
MSADLPVLIAGAGPVGLTLALALLRQGRGVLVFERRRAIPVDARATTLQPPALDAYESLGVLDPIAARGRRVDAVEYWTWGANRARLATVPFAAIRREVGHPYRLHCAQPALCRVLLETIEREYPGVVQFGSTVEGAMARGDAVVVHVRTGSRTRVLLGSWLAGCDGARSRVRSLVQAEDETLGPSDVFFTCEVDGSHPTLRGEGVGDAAYLLTRLGPGLFMRMPDTIRVLYRLPDTAERTLDTATDGPLAQVLFGADRPDAFRNKAVYTVRQRVVKRFRHGRVVLLGDAAHQAWPIAGSAMNCGILDAYTLAQALDSERIDDWAAERRAELVDRVAVDARTFHRRLLANGALAQRRREAFFRRLQEHPAALVDHVRRSAMVWTGVVPFHTLAGRSRTAGRSTAAESAS